MKVRYKGLAESAFLSMPKDIRTKFEDAFRWLERDPTGHQGGLHVEQLRGTGWLYRLEIDNYRGIFRLTGTRVEFLDFGHGHEVYKRFGLAQRRLHRL